MSSAVFHRLSQPREPVRWSKVALITNDMFSVAEARNQNNKGTANAETKDQPHQPGNTYKYIPILISLLCCTWILWLACELCHYSLLRSSWCWFSVSLWELNTKPFFLCLFFVDIFDFSVWKSRFFFQCGCADLSWCDWIWWTQNRWYL